MSGSGLFGSVPKGISHSFAGLSPALPDQKTNGFGIDIRRDFATVRPSN